MTPFGFVWLGTMALCLASKIEYLCCALIVSTIFQSVSVMDVGTFSISAQDVTSALILVRIFFLLRSEVKIDIRAVLAVGFALFALLQGTFVLLLFEGFELKSFVSYFLGYEVEGQLIETGSVPVSLSLQFYIAVARLFLYLLAFGAVVILASNRNRFDRRLVVKMSSSISLAVIVVVGLIQLLGTFVQIDVSAVMTLFHSEEFRAGSAYYNNYRALYSVFAEPSYCGPWLMALGWAILLEGNGSVFTKVTGCLCLTLGVFTFSTTAAVVFVIGLLIYSKRTIKRNPIVVALLIAALVVAVFTVPPIRHLAGIAVHKLTSASGVTRVAYIEQSYSVFVQTFGLGLGFNQVQGMTLIGGLLSQVGIIGTIIFCFFIFKVLKSAARDDLGKFSSLFLVLILFGVEVSCSGLLYSAPLWFAIYLVASCTAPSDSSGCIS